MNKEAETYYSYGKFLLTAEYLVMAGADALVLPVNKGQALDIEPSDNDSLVWESFYQSEKWFNAELDGDTFEIINTTDSDKANYISTLLQSASELSQGSISLKNKKITTRLDFHPEWGMGSSSTLIVNISRLFDINAFDLFSKISNGSGFDIAAGLSGYPFRYRLKKNKREISPVKLPELFFKHAFFVYLGEKTHSEVAVEEFQNSDKDLKMPIKYINEITAQFAEIESVPELSRITKEHEDFMSDVLDIPSPTRRFADYPYGMKSLGAWGGDFIMAIHPKGKAEVEKYFKQKGFPVVFSAEELKVN